MLNLAGLALVALAAVANAEVVDHAFGFDMRYDDQDAEVLDYRYGDSRSPVRAPEGAVSEGKTFVSANVSGPMLRGDFLYVKWRDRDSGEVREDSVDLRQLLPADIAGSRIHFLIRDSKLLVYLISPQARPPEIPAAGPVRYHYRLSTMIYPETNRQ